MLVQIRIKITGLSIETLPFYFRGLDVHAHGILSAGLAYVAFDGDDAGLHFFFEFYVAICLSRSISQTELMS